MASLQELTESSLFTESTCSRPFLKRRPESDPLIEMSSDEDEVEVEQEVLKNFIMYNLEKVEMKSDDETEEKNAVNAVVEEDVKENTVTTTDDTATATTATATTTDDDDEVVEDEDVVENKENQEDQENEEEEEDVEDDEEDEKDKVVDEDAATDEDEDDAEEDAEKEEESEEVNVVDNRVNLKVVLRPHTKVVIPSIITYGFLTLLFLYFMKYTFQLSDGPAITHSQSYPCMLLPSYSFICNNRVCYYNP